MKIKKFAFKCLRGTMISLGCILISFSMILSTSLKNNIIMLGIGILFLGITYILQNKALAIFSTLFLKGIACVLFLSIFYGFWEMGFLIHILAFVGVISSTVLMIFNITDRLYFDRVIKNIN